MLSELSPIRNSQGFSTLESILASAMLLVLVTIFVNALITGQEGALFAGYQRDAMLLAEEGLEAVHNIKEEGFAALSDGTFGLATSSHQWILEGTKDTKGMYTRTITVSAVNASTKKIESTVSWQQNLQRIASTTLATYLTNWKQATESEALALVTDVSQAELSENNKTLRKIMLRNTLEKDATIDKIIVSWTGSNKKTERIRIDNDIVWSKTGPGEPEGTQPSGTEIDNENFKFNDEDEKEMDIKFTGSMSGATFTITLIMSDDSQKTFSVF